MAAQCEKYVSSILRMLAAQCLALLGAGSLLAEEGQIVVEHDRRSPPDEIYGSLVKTDSRRYGDTCVSFYERTSE